MRVKSVALSKLVRQWIQKRKVQVKLRAAALADEMLMVPFGGQVPLGNTIVDVRVANEAFLFQELQSAVHGGHVYLGKARMDALENVVHGNLAGNGLQRVKDDLALEREAVTPFP